MTFYATHYQTGEEILPGDRILLAGKPGKVLFVLGLPGVSADWVSPEECLDETKGFMLEVDDMGFVFQNESDEDLEFVERKQ
jgi:hypothetical protein